MCIHKYALLILLNGIDYVQVHEYNIMCSYIIMQTYQHNYTDEVLLLLE